MSNRNASWINKDGIEVRRYRGAEYAVHDRGCYLVGQASVPEFGSVAEMKRYIDDLIRFDRKPWDACG
jgi:hypothetical protein